MEKVKEFFWYCAGAKKGILSQAQTDSEKYVGIGATVFFTGVFAAIAASYALFTVFDSVYSSVVFGILWGLMIFNLDRFIVSSMRKKENKFNELIIASPRIILAILISIVIAKPLELKIFEKEINSELVSMRQEVRSAQEEFVLQKYSAQEKPVYERINTLKNEVESKVKERDHLAEEARKEADGTGGTMLRNAGPIYKLKKTDADRVDKELSELKTKNQTLISQNQSELTLLDSAKKSELSELVLPDISGPAARLEALDRLTNKSSAIAIASVFIMLLFILIESAPILVKLISDKGPYDYLLEATEYKFETAIIKDKAFIHSELKKEAEELERIEKEFVLKRLNLKLENLK